MGTSTPLSTDDIQGSVLAGFNTDHQSFVFVSFPGEMAQVATTTGGDFGQPSMSALTLLAQPPAVATVA